MNSGIILTGAGASDARAVQSYSGATSANSIAAENFPRWHLPSTAVAAVKGTMQGHRLRLRPGVYSTVTLMKGATVGTALANCYVAVYDIASNVRLAVSADVSSTLGAATDFEPVTAALAFTCTAEADYWVCLQIGNSTTTAPSWCGVILQDHPLWKLAPALGVVHNTTGLDTVAPNPLVPHATSVSSGFWIRFS